MSLNGKFLDKDHLSYFWSQLKLKFATAAQGSKADTAVQTIKINGTTQTKTNGVVNLPAYPTTLPASNTTSTYSSSGTSPVNGVAVNAALGTLDVSSVGGTGKVISAISETNGKISATATTMDIAPTPGSSNPVTSDGVASSQASQDEIISQHTAAMAKSVNEGSKNKLKFSTVMASSNNYGTSILTNGVRFTVNSDGSVTVNRESANSSPAYVYLSLDSGAAITIDDFCTGEYVLSGCPSDGSANTYRMYAAKSTYSAYDVGSGVVLPSTSTTGILLLISIHSSYDAQNLVFRPMICKQEDWAISHSFVPYCPTLYELYQMILSDGQTRSIPQASISTSTKGIKFEDISKDDIDEDELELDK